MIKNSKLPLISVVITTFNEEKNIERCLQSIKKQNYPQDRIEIIIIDDYSEDKTVEIAKKFGALVFFSGSKSVRHIERSKSVGISKTGGDLILFLDADIKIISSSWIKKSARAIINNRKVVGAQNIYWQYKREHNIFNRYCELFGVNDPFVYMLGKRGILGSFEKKWINKNQIIRETEDYFLTKFNISNLPTLGSQSFLVRKEMILKSNWTPYFFHMDSVYELVQKGFDSFSLMKLEIEHNYVSDIWGFYRKLYRNINLFLKYRNFRKYDYQVGSSHFFLTLIIMISFIYPLAQSIRGYARKPDVAWFLHPIFCFTVPILYAFAVIKFILFYFK